MGIDSKGNLAANKIMTMDGGMTIHTTNGIITGGTMAGTLKTEFSVDGEKVTMFYSSKIKG